MHKSSLLHTHGCTRGGSSTLFKVIMDLMSRKGTFYYRLISVYYRRCGLMSVLAECVLIQGLDPCQALACRSKDSLLCDLF